MENQSENFYHISRSALYLVCGIVMATYLKIWLCRCLLLRAVYAPHDDNHFVTLASHILNGDWLGPFDKYTQYTLMKGVFYPLFISFCNVAGIPLVDRAAFIILSRHAFCLFSQYLHMLRTNGGSSLYLCSCCLILSL